MAETTVATPAVSKTEIRRAAEKALRASHKPDYRGNGVAMSVLKPNPKRTGSKAHAVFARYADGLAVAELLALAEKGEIVAANGEVISKSYVGACLMWDERHGFIALSAPAPVAK